MVKLAKNKKGVFFSLSIVFLMAILIIFFNSKADIVEDSHKFRTEKAKIIAMDHFINDFNRHYIEQIISAPIKPALINITHTTPFNWIDKIKFQSIMVDGEHAGIVYLEDRQTTDNIFGQALSTLTFTPKVADFIYTLNEVTQEDYDTIKFSFLVDYEFQSFDITWSKTDLPMDIYVDIYGLWHPEWSDQVHKVINEEWIKDTDDSGCFHDMIFTDGETCTDPDFNIVPCWDPPCS
jgi:ribosomal protein L31